MSKFMESEIYGSCQVNNDTTVFGKVYNDDILYVSFSVQSSGATEEVNVDITAHIRRFDNTLTKSGVPMVHWWFALAGSGASGNQGPYDLDYGDGAPVITTTTGYMLDNSPGTGVDNGALLYTSITNAATHDLTINILVEGINFPDPIEESDTIYINMMVQGIVYSQPFYYWPYA